MKKQKSTKVFRIGENRFVFLQGAPEGPPRGHEDPLLDQKGGKGNEIKNPDLGTTGLEARPVKPVEVGAGEPISYEEAAGRTIGQRIAKLEENHANLEEKAREAVAYTNTFLDKMGIGRDALKILVPHAEHDRALYQGICDIQKAIGVTPDGKIGGDTLTAIFDYKNPADTAPPDIKLLGAIAKFITEAKLAGITLETIAAKARKTRKARAPAAKPETTEPAPETSPLVARLELQMNSMPYADFLEKVKDDHNIPIETLRSNPNINVGNYTTGQRLMAETIGEIIGRITTSRIIRETEQRKSAETVAKKEPSREKEPTQKTPYALRYEDIRDGLATLQNIVENQIKKDGELKDIVNPTYVAKALRNTLSRNGISENNLPSETEIRRKIERAQNKAPLITLVIDDYLASAGKDLARQEKEAPMLAKKYKNIFETVGGLIATACDEKNKMPQRKQARYAINELLAKNYGVSANEMWRINAAIDKIGSDQPKPTMKNAIATELAEMALKGDSALGHLDDEQIKQAQFAYNEYQDERLQT